MTICFFRPISHFVIVSALLFLGACSTKPKAPPMPSPEGQLSIMGHASQLNLDAPPEDWIISPARTSARDALHTVQRDGISALEIRSSGQHIIAARKVDAMMLATPFLSWIWHLSNHGEGIHPVRLIIGFYGGAPEDSETLNHGHDLPGHDRALVLVWGDTALKRGSLSLPPIDRPLEAPVYTVRGGRENTRKWWSEAVDLSDLYAKAWPMDNRRKARITFIGIAAPPTPEPVRGRVARILLTR